MLRLVGLERPVRLRSYLVALVVAVLLPVVALAAYLTIVSAERERHAIERGMRETARALSLAIDGQVATAMASLEALASSSNFRRGDFEAFRAEAEEFLNHHEGWLSVVDETGQQHLNTRLPQDAPLPKTDNHAWLHDVFTAPRFFVTGAVTGPVVRMPFVAISRVAEAGGTRVVLVLSIAPSTLSATLLNQRLPSGWYGVVADRDSVIIARTRNPGLIGTPMTMAPVPPGGFARAVTHEGERVYLAWTASELSGWSTGVAAPAAVIDGPAYQGTINAIGLTAIALTLAVGAGLYFGRRLTFPIDHLVQEVQSGKPAARAGPSPITEINVLAAAFRAKVTALLEALSDRDAAQAELEKLNEELEARVRARSIELERLNETLLQTQKQESLGRLTGGIAHDFNNLLTAVLGNLELLSKRLPGGEAQKYIGGARSAAQKGAELTSQLLAFSRNQYLEPKPIDVNLSVRNMADMFTRTLGGTIRIETHLGSDVGLALADSTQLDLVILNLAINARDAMPMGGRLLIETYEAHVSRADRPEAPVPGDYIVIAVTDNGAGMTEEVLARAFEPFYTTKEVGKGSGLGLPHVLGVTKQLGGGICINTRPGEGTRVEVYLPRAEGRVTGTKPAARELDSTGLYFANTHVLLVDDDPDVRSATASMLQHLGCVVDEAGSGPAAVEIIDRKRIQPDVLIIDFAMPGLNGIDTARRIRELAPELPIILVSGFAEAERLRSEGRLPLLTKPFGLDELARSLAQVCSTSGNVVSLHRAEG